MLSLYFNMIILRRQPHELPYNPLAIAFWLLLDFGLVFLVANTFGERVVANISLEVFDVAFSALAIWLVLWLHKHKERFIQTYTAVLGVNVILFGALVIASLILGDDIFRLLVQPIYIWFLIVVAYIFKDALEVPWLKAIFWVMLIEVARVIIVVQLLRGIE